jgi:hypothetical protein
VNQHCDENIWDLALWQQCRYRMKSCRLLRLVDWLIVRTVIPSPSSLHMDCLTIMIKALWLFEIQVTIPVKTRIIMEYERYDKFVVCNSISPWPQWTVDYKFSSVVYKFIDTSVPNTMPLFSFFRWRERIHIKGKMSEIQQLAQYRRKTKKTFLLINPFSSDNVPVHGLFLWYSGNRKCKYRIYF